MSVKRATQVFSHSVSAAMKTSIITGELTSETASNTAEFVDFIDKLFDCLDSRNIFSKNPYKSALSTTNSLAQGVLEEGVRLFREISKIDYKTKKCSRPPCFDGFVQTITGINMLFTKEIE